MNFSNKNKIIKRIVVALVVIIVAFAIIPMLVMQGNYIFIIHDGLDSYAADVQMIRERCSLFDYNNGQSFTEGLNNHYCILGFELYNVLNIVFGYVWGQIITRTFGVIFGLFSMFLLLKKIFPIIDYKQSILHYIISMTYAITTCAPNRQIAFATLPFFVWFYIYLKENEEFTKLVLIGIILPFVSAFNSFLVFLLPVWFILTVIDSIRKRKIQQNLLVSFFLMSISTVVVNWNSIRISLIAGETNRSLMVNLEQAKISFDSILQVLLQGQYHSAPRHEYIILPIVAIGSIYILANCICDIRYFKHNRKYILLLIFGWIYWIITALLSVIKISTGLTVIDGFDWSRCITVMRLVWYMMIAVILYVSVECCDNSYKRKKIVFIIGLVLSIVISFYFLKFPYGTYMDGLRLRKLLDISRFILVLAFTIILFLNTKKKYIYLVVFTVLLVQCMYLFVSKTTYNDTGASVYAMCTEDKKDSTITFNEFFSTDLFNEIKDDIEYDSENEWVAAYGFHPAVLTCNGFNTIDRYQSLHSMRDQIEFREIIAPALERYPESANYYDTWGGRMYLYGDLDYQPTRIKCTEDESYALYINVDAFKKYKGKYILSRGLISNSNEIGLEYINDYDNEKSLYHIYLYEAK